MSRIHCLLILGLASCPITGSSRTAQATAPGQLDVQVMLYQGASVEKLAPASVRQAATVALRSATGLVLYSGPTDTNGLAHVPLSGRPPGLGQQIEARLDLGDGYSIGGIVWTRPGVTKYRVAIAPPGAFFPESEISISGQ